MSHITLPDHVISMLGNLGVSKQLFDERGKPIGYYVSPAADAISLPGPDPFSDEEIEEALKDRREGITTAELLEKLRRL